MRFHGHGKTPIEFAHHACPFSTCKVSFDTPSKLQRHLDVHENRVLSCPYCPYRNANSYQIHDHLMIHFNIKKYECDLCPRKFTTNGELTLHHKREHSNEDFVCVDCKFTAAKLAAYNRHRKSCKERLKHSRIL